MICSFSFLRGIHYLCWACVVFINVGYLRHLVHAISLITDLLIHVKHHIFFINCKHIKLSDEMLISSHYFIKPMGQNRKAQNILYWVITTGCMFCNLGFKWLTKDLCGCKCIHQRCYYEFVRRYEGSVYDRQTFVCLESTWGCIQIALMFCSHVDKTGRQLAYGNAIAVKYFHLITACHLWWNQANHFSSPIELSFFAQWNSHVK